MPSKPIVLVVGATGATGRPITEVLLESVEFARSHWYVNVAVLTRPSSVSKPEVEALRAKGAEIRTADIHSDSVEVLMEAVSGVDILISAANAMAILAQKPLFSAAKAAGVKHVVPCDFATPGKLEVRDCVKELGLGYTFIDIGWWHQGYLPSSTNSPSILGPMSHEIYGDGNRKNLLTDVEHLGMYVARIVGDERTLNQNVIVWEDEKTLLEAQEIGERISGESNLIRSKRTNVTYEELVARAKAGKEAYQRSHSYTDLQLLGVSEYMISMHILGENTLENAKALGALNVRELYPDIKPVTLEEYAKRFYKTA
ncbi:NAD(P)-binding protein [Wolfiporia cocos MD-104 SS10]|uniref:NAD(P)-binding protein n=1 Tax=Wolfiporia cocos (strain MD-104) TaxID=742152 RepID=A0A2H3JPP9_WOLCO|nr:NAD(P)-binding protein [Wolfiporia cocos MD-104 SS10]